MGKKKYFLIVDTETTQDDFVADFGAIIVDKQGLIVNQCGVLVKEYYLDRQNHPLFHMGQAENLWAKANLPNRYAAYDKMVDNGVRMIATVRAINQWLARALATYDPVLTAYNLAFDRGKCRNTGIDLDMFQKQFCLWHSSARIFGGTKSYLQFIMDNHLFNPPTALGNMSIKTNAEVMARFVLNNPAMPNEPHTALEDARDYELPILKAIVKRAKVSDYMTPEPYSWQHWQVKDFYKPR